MQGDPSGDALASGCEALATEVRGRPRAPTAPDAPSPCLAFPPHGRPRFVAPQLRELAAVQPATGSFFVRLFLGQVNVKVASPRDRETLRDEYNKFKDRTNLGVIFAGAVWALTLTVLQFRFRYTGWIFTLTHLWLLYYYVSLALRENILRMVRARARLGGEPRAQRRPTPRAGRPPPPLPSPRRTARPSGRGGSCTTTCPR